MSQAEVETLERVIRSLRSALIRFRPERNHCLTIRPTELSELRREIQDSAQCLTKFPADLQQTSDLKRKVAEYRANLQEMTRVLPDLQLRLLAEKRRLEMAQTQATRAARWAQTSRKTL